VTYERADVAYGRGDLEQARIWFEESSRQHREIGDTWNGAKALEGLARAEIRQRRLRSAAELLRDSLRFRREYGLLEGFVKWLTPVTMLAAAVGDFDAAAQVLGVSTRFREELGKPLQSPEREDIEETQASVRTALGETLFTEAFEASKTRVIDDVVRLGEEILAGVDILPHGPHGALTSSEPVVPGSRQGSTPS
jgi:hypothetical protein